MDFAIEDSAEQGSFREEVRSWLAENVPEGTEYPVDPGDLTLEQYQHGREFGRRLGARGWLYPNMPTKYNGGDLAVGKVPKPTVSGAAD